MIACASEPFDALTMVDSAVAMNSALPRPQPARKPITAPTLPDEPARAADDDDQREPAEKRALRSDPARHHAGDEHGDAHHRHVAGEQQRDLARRRVQLRGDLLEDRVDQPDPHERDHAGERRPPRRRGVARASSPRSTHLSCGVGGVGGAVLGQHPAQHGDGGGEVGGGVVRVAGQAGSHALAVRGADAAQLLAPVAR